MAFAPPVKSKFSTNLAKSTWTPMNHPESNTQVFEERKELIQKWFQKWQDSQKRIIVNDILKNLSNKHLISLHETLNGKFPQEKYDFTRILPRVLTLYLFSFLDPRTLCRCAQVSWYWNYLAEMDCLWRPKCLKFGWYPTYQPSPFEEKIWKRFYVSTVHELNFTKAKSLESKSHETVHKRPDSARSITSRASIAKSTTSSVTGLKKGPSVPSTKKPLSGPKWEPPPWKGSDPHPIDTMRYNYLDNMSKSKKKQSPHRPSSKQSKRPQSASGTPRSARPDDGQISSPGRGAPRYDDVDARRRGSISLDKTTRLSGATLAGYSGSGTIPSPRLNKNFQLPQYNGHDANASTNLGMTSTLNSSQYGTAGITSQVNWPPSLKQNQNGAVTLQQTVERPSSSYTKTQSQHQADAQNPLNQSADLRKSLDAGLRPRPVAKLTPKKELTFKEKPGVKSEGPEKSVTSTNDLTGKGWEPPTNSNSDDENF